MRIAFFGGTFDPPHRGHLAIARAAAERLRLDRVIFAPVGHQPLKKDSSQASFADRVAMVRLAIAGDPRFGLSLLDAPRADGRPNYTIDTLRQMRAKLNPEDRLFCLVGADSFLSLPRWYRARDLLFLCDFIIAGRPGFDLDDTQIILPEGVRAAGKPHHLPGLSTVQIAGDNGGHSTLYFLPDLREEISATELREALSGSQVESGALPPPVVEYIRAHHLYQ